MTTDSGSGALAFDPAHLGGHTLEVLTDYLDAGRTPLDRSIEESAGCQLVLDALERLHRLTPRMVEADAAAEPQADESWVERVVSSIVLDARAGRRIPLGSPEGVDLGITEGAVRGLVRAAEDSIPGLLVGRCRLDGDVTDPEALVRIHVEASVPYGEPIARLAERLREEIRVRLARHTELRLAEIDITVLDITVLDIRMPDGEPV